MKCFLCLSDLTSANFTLIPKHRKLKININIFLRSGFRSLHPLRMGSPDEQPTVPTTHVLRGVYYTTASHSIFFHAHATVLEFHGYSFYTLPQAPPPPCCNARFIFFIEKRIEESLVKSVGLRHSFDSAAAGGN